MGSVLRGTVQGKELSGTVFQLCQELLARKKMKLLLLLLVVVLAGLVSGMDVGKGGVYDSPMAQDYYVKRFGFMFGGGRSGMYGLKALQADGLVQQRQEVKPAMVQMRNSVDTYYRNTYPTPKTTSSSYSFNRFRSQPLLRAKPMVELAPKRMGSTYFNTFMA